MLTFGHYFTKQDLIDVFSTNGVADNLNTQLASILRVPSNPSASIYPSKFGYTDLCVVPGAYPESQGYSLYCPFRAIAGEDINCEYTYPTRQQMALFISHNIDVLNANDVAGYLSSFLISPSITFDELLQETTCHESTIPSWATGADALEDQMFELIITAHASENTSNPSIDNRQTFMLLGADVNNITNFYIQPNSAYESGSNYGNPAAPVDNTVFNTAYVNSTISLWDIVDWDTSIWFWSYHFDYTTIQSLQDLIDFANGTTPPPISLESRVEELERTVVSLQTQIDNIHLSSGNFIAL